MNREDFKENVKIALMLAGIFALIATPIAIAVTVWHGSITWTVEVKDFTVWDSLEDGSELATWSEDLGTLTSPYPTVTRDFYLQNDGTVDFTVTVTETLETGCSGEWSAGGSYVLIVGGVRVLATLTLTITGPGSYDFQFEIVS